MRTSFARLLYAGSALVCLPLLGCVGDRPALDETALHPAPGQDAGGPVHEDAGPVYEDGGLVPTDAGPVQATDGAIRKAPEGGPPAERRRCGATAFVGVRSLESLNGAADESMARLTPDELTLYYNQRVGAGPWTIYVTTRAERSAQFARPMELALIPVATSPVLSPDGQRLYYTADDKQGGPNLYVSKQPFSAMNSEALRAINTNKFEHAAYISRDGEFLYFARRDLDSDPPPHLADDLLVSKRVGDTFGPPTPLEELNTPYTDRSPVISADNLRLYFGSDRPGSRGTDIYMASRDHVDDRFGPAIPLLEVNSEKDEFPSWISDDECSLYFSSTRPQGKGGFDLFMATRD